MHVLGIDLGATKVSGAVFTGEGTLVDRRAQTLDGRAGAEVGRLVGTVATSLMEKTGAGRVGAVGVCVTGISGSATGRVWAPNIPGWEAYPLQEELRAVVGAGGPLVCVDSDRACSMLGEAWRGAARGCANAVFLAVGTGIGAGILVEGSILRGTNDVAGATGWMALERPFRSEYTACGCFEYQASGEGLARVARDYLRKRKDYAGVLRSKDPATLNAHDVFAAFDGDDSLARDVIQNAIACWGMAVANLVSLFNPEVVIFGGGVFGPAARFLPEIAEEAKRWGQPVSMSSVRILASALGSDAALYGAAYLAIRSLGDPDTL
jgi:glucokinase